MPTSYARGTNWEGHRSLSVESTPPTLLSINSPPSPLSAKLCFHECALIRSEVRNLPNNQKAYDHIKRKRHTWEGCSRLSIVCTPPTLVSITSSPSPLFSKFCSTSFHQSVQKLEFYHLITRLKPTSFARGILGRAVNLCPSNAHP